MAVRLWSLRPSLDGTASRDLGSAEYCKSRRTFAAEFLCMALKIGSLLPSSRLDGLALRSLGAPDAAFAWQVQHLVHRMLLLRGRCST